MQTTLSVVCTGHVSDKRSCWLHFCSELDKSVVSSNQMSATSFGASPSCERLRGEGLAWSTGTAVCLLAAAAGLNLNLNLNDVD